MKDMISNFFKIRKYRKRFSKYYEAYAQTKATPAESYAVFRKLFVLTKGKLNDDLSHDLTKQVGKYEAVEEEGVLGNPASFAAQVAQMKKDGYYIFDKVLDQPMIDAILSYAQRTPVSYLDVETGDYTNQKVLFDESHIVSPRYQFSGNEIFGCKHLQQLIFDPSLLAFAQEYLGLKPILDLVAFWWSAPFEGKGKSAAAQMYHFDLDRIKFLKFFFYITDVDTHTGPHCYVKGSHGKLPKGIDRDGRFEDDEIAAVYGKENLLELCGKRGSIMAVDTRGFHKGKDLLKGKRLLFQIQFTNSLFGQSYEKIDYNLVNPQYAHHIKKYEYSYNDIC